MDIILIVIIVVIVVLFALIASAVYISQRQKGKTVGGIDPNNNGTGTVYDYDYYICTWTTIDDNGNIRKGIMNLIGQAFDIKLHSAHLSSIEKIIRSNRNIINDIRADRGYVYTNMVYDKIEHYFNNGVEIGFVRGGILYSKADNNRGIIHLPAQEIKYSNGRVVTSDLPNCNVIFTQIEYDVYKIIPVREIKHYIHTQLATGAILVEEVEEKDDLGLD